MLGTAFYQNEGAEISEKDISDVPQSQSTILISSERVNVNSWFYFQSQDALSHYTTRWSQYVLYITSSFNHLLMNICVYLWSVVRFVEVAWLPRPLLYAVIFTGVPLDKRRVLGRLRSIRDTELHDHYPRARRWNSCIHSHSCQHSMWYLISWYKVQNKSNLNIAAATVEGCMGTATVWSDTAQSWGAASSLLMGCRTSKNRTETLMLFGHNNIAKEVFWSCTCQLITCIFVTPDTQKMTFIYVHLVLFCCVGVITL